MIPNQFILRPYHATVDHYVVPYDERGCYMNFTHFNSF